MVRKKLFVSTRVSECARVGGGLLVVGERKRRTYVLGIFEYRLYEGAV